MRGKLSRVTVLLLVAAGCSTTGTPATVPSSLPAVTPTVAVTTTTVPPTTVTTTAETTTTLDRIAEIEAIFQDLEERRLQALYDGDRETFKTLFANQEYLERSLGAFEVMEFEGPPEVRVDGLEIIHDGAVCIAARYQVERVDLGALSTPTVVVIEVVSNTWGYSHSGEGWACAGPHPFSP